MALGQLFALTQLLCVVSAAADGRRGLKDGASAAGAVVAEELPPAVTSGSLLELTNATLERRLRAVASPEKCIIFTTTSAFLPPLLNMTRNWFAHVHKCVRSWAHLPVLPLPCRKLLHEPVTGQIEWRALCPSGRVNAAVVPVQHAQPTCHCTRPVLKRMHSKCLSPFCAG
jgi:hypothetical protein